MPSPDQEGHDPNTEEWDPNKRHINAVVATIQGVHVCLGFIYPQCTHMAFTKDRDKNRLIERHTSDFVRTISDAGFMDLVHPAGAHIRIGEGDEPDELEGNDFDGVFKLKHNKETIVAITLLNRSAKKICKLRLCPSGDIDVFAERNIRIRALGDVAVDASGNASITAGKTVSIVASRVQVCTSEAPITSKAWVIGSCDHIADPLVCG